LKTTQNQVIAGSAALNFNPNEVFSRDHQFLWVMNALFGSNATRFTAVAPSHKRPVNIGIPSLDDSA